MTPEVRDATVTLLLQTLDHLQHDCGHCTGTHSVQLMVERVRDGLIRLGVEDQIPEWAR